MLPASTIKPTPPENAAKMQALIEAMREAHTEEGAADGMRLEHHLHAGCYCRTLYCPKDRIFVSERIVKPTLLIVSGDAVFSDGDNAVRITGYKVLLGAQGRQSIVRTLEDTVFTAVFATNAKTVAEAEREAAAHPEQLLKLQELQDNELCISSDGRDDGCERGQSGVSGKAVERPRGGGEPPSG